MSGPTRVLSKRVLPFVYRAITCYGQTFQNVRLDKTFVTLSTDRRQSRKVPRPPIRNAVELTRMRFRLFPVRSPLLRE